MQYSILKVKQSHSNRYSQNIMTFTFGFQLIQLLSFVVLWHVLTSLALHDVEEVSWN